MDMINSKDIKIIIFSIFKILDCQIINISNYLQIQCIPSTRRILASTVQDLFNGQFRNVIISSQIISIGPPPLIKDLIINNMKGQSLISNESILNSKTSLYQQQKPTKFFGRILKQGQIFNFSSLTSKQQIGDILSITNVILAPHSNDSASLYINKEYQEYLIATLTKDLSQIMVKILLDKSDNVSLIVKGKGILHITGFYEHKQRKQQKQIKQIQAKDELDIEDEEPNEVVNQAASTDKNNVATVATKQIGTTSKTFSHDLQFLPFRIPAIENGLVKKSKKVIGIIDASGSMSSCWNDLTKFWNQSLAKSVDFIIVFDTTAKRQNNTVLSENLHKHRGGGTNILAAFQMLQICLIGVQESASITIIFISDGCDTTHRDRLRQKMKKLRGGQGRDITMLCLGIQSGFPTKIAMQIRKLYHTGDQKIPALYLIEYASEKAFFNKFETMSNCFKVSNDVKVLINNKEWKEYPWEEQRNSILKEGQWILVHNSKEDIKLIYNEKDIHKYAITPFQVLSLDDIVDCFRGWTQKIQLLSMDIEQMISISKIAEVTANIIKKYTNVYQRHHNLFILSEKPLGLKETFGTRAGRLAVKNIGSRIKWFIDELLIIAKGVGIGGLGQFEAAKRIGIGTITGKYHQKALALKGITKLDFENIKQQFNNIFIRTKLSDQPSSQDCSIFTLQNQKEVFQQPDFLYGLKLCQNQFDLIQSFPVVGYSLKVKRYDGSMMNPWKVQVLQLAKTHKSIDSVYLANNNNKYELSIGEGKIEQINAVLPLFSEKDIEMSPLLNSKLFKLAISFMVVQNIDTFHEQAYLALLASTYVFLLKQPQSQWRDNLFNLIHTSLLVTYWQMKQFRKFIQKSLIEPYLLFTNKQKEDHTDITKVMLLVDFIHREKLLSPQKLSHFVDLVMVHYAEKTYIQNKFKMSRIAKMQLKSLQQLQVIKNSTTPYESNEFNIIKSYDQLKEIVEKDFSSVAKLDQIDFKFNEKIFLHHQEGRRVTYDHIKSFYENIKKKELQNIEFIYYFGHSLKGKTPEIYNTPISRDIDSVKAEVLKTIDIKSLSPQEGKIVKDVKKIIENQYIGLFQRTHFGIVPLSKSKLKQDCLEKGLNYKALQLHEISGMVMNACMSPSCKYYLQPLKGHQLTDHMRLWRKSLPSRFHIQVVPQLKQQKSSHQIFDYLLTQGHVNLKRHRKTEEEVLQYIKKIRKSLKS